MNNFIKKDFSTDCEQIIYLREDEDIEINKAFPVKSGSVIPYPTNFIKKMYKKAYKELVSFYEIFSNEVEGLEYIGSVISNKKKGNIVSYFNDKSNNRFIEMFHEKVNETLVVKMVVIFNGLYEEKSV